MVVLDNKPTFDSPLLEYKDAQDDFSSAVFETTSKPLWRPTSQVNRTIGTPRRPMYTYMHRLFGTKMQSREADLVLACSVYADLVLLRQSAVHFIMMHGSLASSACCPLTTICLPARRAKSLMRVSSVLLSGAIPVSRRATVKSVDFAQI